MAGVIEHEKAVALFERRRDAWLSEDLDAYLSLFDPGLVYQGPVGEPVYGRDNYGDLVRRSYKAVRPVSFDFHEIAVHDTRVLAEATITFELRANGRRLSYRYMSICDIKDGLITWWREYYDTSHLNRGSGESEEEVS